MNDSTNKVLLDVADNGVATITLNNPDKHNAFDDSVIELLIDALNTVSNNEDTRILVLASSGKSFSAGADLGWMKRMAAYDYEENLTDSRRLALLFHTLNTLNKPTIAKIQGAAFGGAVGLAACCDIVIASTRASFCLSEVKLGLIPATISPYVIRAIGEKASRRYFLTAELFNAQTALQLGLISEVVEEDNLTATADEMISLILANGPEAVVAAKALINDIASQPIREELIEDTCHRIAQIRVSEQGQEGLSAFFDKRPANWQSYTLIKDKNDV